MFYIIKAVLNRTDLDREPNYNQTADSLYPLRYKTYTFYMILYGTPAYLHLVFM